MSKWTMVTLPNDGEVSSVDLVSQSHSFELVCTPQTMPEHSIRCLGHFQLRTSDVWQSKEG